MADWLTLFLLRSIDSWLQPDDATFIDSILIVLRWLEPFSIDTFCYCLVILFIVTTAEYLMTETVMADGSSPVVFIPIIYSITIDIDITLPDGPVFNTIVFILTDPDSVSIDVASTTYCVTRMWPPISDLTWRVVISLIYVLVMAVLFWRIVIAIQYQMKIPMWISYVLWL